jgi:hypothetical protein
MRRKEGKSAVRRIPHVGASQNRAGRLPKKIAIICNPLISTSGKPSGRSVFICPHLYENLMVQVPFLIS